MKQKGSRASTAQCGFTLVEMLLVVVAVALLAAVGVPICMGTYKKMQVEKAARNVLFAARYARMTAIELQSPCRLVLDAQERALGLTVHVPDEVTGRTEWVPFRDSCFKGPLEFEAGVEFEDIQIAPRGAQYVADADDEQTILFLPNGTAQTALVQVGNGKTRRTVSVCAATGRAKLYLGGAENVEIRTTDLDER
jgi:prepilin-type N-terminal cleavage/methylation domain-containing protein